jgi:hypothetical protein
MPEPRQGEALAIVREVAAVNGVRHLRWYKYESKDEFCCYWDGHTANVLWITPTNVHIQADSPLVRRPSCTVTWRDHDGACVGWLLPGADAGTGGGRSRPKAAKVRCPVTHLWLPAGTVCPDCDLVQTE